MQGSTARRTSGDRRPPGRSNHCPMRSSERSRPSDCWARSWSGSPRRWCSRRPRAGPRRRGAARDGPGPARHLLGAAPPACRRVVARPGVDLGAALLRPRGGRRSGRPRSGDRPVRARPYERPDHFAVPGRHGAPRAGPGLHQAEAPVGRRPASRAAAGHRRARRDAAPGPRTDMVRVMSVPAFATALATSSPTICRPAPPARAGSTRRRPPPRRRPPRPREPGSGRSRHSCNRSSAGSFAGRGVAGLLASWGAGDRNWTAPSRRMRLATAWSAAWRAAAGRGAQPPHRLAAASHIGVLRHPRRSARADR
jgi:hypothetical protein